MAQFGREVDEVLEEIDRAMAALRANWEGQASETQQQSQQQWEDGAEQMRTSLEALRKVAENAHKNYTDAVDKNGKMWAG
jgi:WXG100 family type VII secretion target